MYQTSYDEEADSIDHDLPLDHDESFMGLIEPEHEKIHRVKLYQLNNSGEWDDKGTGFCELLPGDSPLIVIRHETTGSVLLSHRFDPHTINYSLQGATIINWSETVPNSHHDDVNLDEHDVMVDCTQLNLAISFQESASCNYFWDYRTQLLEVDSVFEIPSEETLDDIRSDLQLYASRSAAESPQERENVVNSILDAERHESFITKIAQLAEIGEMKNNLNLCYTACRCIHSIFLLANANLLQCLLQEPLISHVMCALEFDERYPSPSHDLLSDLSSQPYQQQYQ